MGYDDLIKKIMLAKLVQEDKVPCINPILECRLEEEDALVIADNICEGVGAYMHIFDNIIDAYIEFAPSCHRLLTLSGDVQETKKRPKLFYYHHGNVTASSFFSKKIMPNSIYRNIIHALGRAYKYFDELENDND